MITKVTGKGFKNLDFEQDLEQNNLIAGPNGSGKSARTQALMMAILGFIPGTDEKRNDRILNNYTTGDKMTVSCLINKTEFGREWKRTPKGTVNQIFLLNGVKESKEDFIGAMVSNGKPAIMDLSAFMGLSDAKKINKLFQLFPPDADVGKLDNDIDKLTTRKNTIYENIRAAEKSIERLSTDRANLQLPAGTLAEVTADIKANEKEIERVKGEINAIKTKEAEREAAEKARIEAEEKAKTQPDIIEEPFFPEIDAKNDKHATPDAPGSTFERFGLPEHDPKESIQKIIDGIIKVNCKICVNGAAMIIAKTELKKY